MSGHRVLARGLRFPEGPVWMQDGSVVLVEIARGTITRVAPDGTVSVVATPGDGPNGLALGPDGAFYCCNNGGFDWLEQEGRLRPTFQPAELPHRPHRAHRPRHRRGARALRPLRRACAARAERHRVRRRGRLLLHRSRQEPPARPRLGRRLLRARRRLAHQLPRASRADPERHRPLARTGAAVYVAETETARLWAFDLEAPGVARKQAHPSPHGGRLHLPGSAASSASTASRSKRRAISASPRW